jgi:hypothetical protein
MAWVLPHFTCGKLMEQRDGHQIQAVISGFHGLFPNWTGSGVHNHFEVNVNWMRKSMTTVEMNRPGVEYHVYHVIDSR